jgi:uncharacterized tellurite resistance protein B-like protein
MISSMTTEAIEKFTTMVRRSMQARSKDLRLDMTDATNLMVEIANLATRLAVYEYETVKRIATTTAEMDGGAFDGDK